MPRVANRSGATAASHARQAHDASTEVGTRNAFLKEDGRTNTMPTRGRMFRSFQLASARVDQLAPDIFGAYSDAAKVAMRKNPMAMLRAVIGYIGLWLTASSMPPSVSPGYEAVSRCDPKKCMHVRPRKSKLIRMDKDGYPVITLGYRYVPSTSQLPGSRAVPTEKKVPVTERISRIMALAKHGYKDGCEVTIPEGYKQPDFRCLSKLRVTSARMALKREYLRDSGSLSEEEKLMLLQGTLVTHVGQLQPGVKAATFLACHVGDGCKRGGRKGRGCINPYHIKWADWATNRSHRACNHERDGNSE